MDVLEVYRLLSDYHQSNFRSSVGAIAITHPLMFTQCGVSRCCVEALGLFMYIIYPPFVE
jgi:hypothetical protein